MQIDDKQLIADIRAGSHEAFDFLCGRYYAPMTAYARLFLGGRWAEDIVQDVLANVWTHRGGLDIDQSLYGYLLKCVYNTSINYANKLLQGSKYTSHYLERMESEVYSMYDPEANPVIRRIYSADMMTAIEAAIAKLPEKRGQVFRMNYVQGMSQKEISRELGLSLRTVENHIFLALKQLRTLIEKVDLVE